jgi:hypothetical protein
VKIPAFSTVIKDESGSTVNVDDAMVVEDDDVVDDDDEERGTILEDEGDL